MRHTMFCNRPGMITLKGAALLAAVLSLPVMLPAQADTLLIERTRAEKAVAQDLPSRGMTMQQVEARFGAPQEVKPAVGEPPITRWVYKDFIVYFEHQYVLHSVLTRK